MASGKVAAKPHWKKVYNKIWTIPIDAFTVQLPYGHHVIFVDGYNASSGERSGVYMVGAENESHVVTVKASNAVTFSISGTTLTVTPTSSGYVVINIYQME